MQGRSPRPFGQRNRGVPAAAFEASPAPVEAEVDAHRAFFAAVRAEDEAALSRQIEVSRSLRAAVLAGLNATGKIASLRGLAAAIASGTRP